MAKSTQPDKGKSGAAPDERYVNQTQLAGMKQPPVNRQAVRNAVSRGLLILHGEGRAARIDLQCPMTVAYLNGAQVSPGKKKAARPKPKPPASNADKASPPPEPSPPPPPPDADAKLDAFMDKTEVELHIKAENLVKLKLDNKKKRNELIDRDKVAVFVNSMHEIDNGLWKTMGMNIASDVAAVFDSDDDELVRATCAVIEKKVFDILKQVKREQNKFLKKIGAAKLLKEGKAA